MHGKNSKKKRGFKVSVIDLIGSGVRDPTPFFVLFFGETDPALSSAVSQLQRMEHGGCLQLSLFIAHLHSNDKRVFIPPTLYPPLKIMQIFTSFCVSTHQSMALEMLYNFATKSKRIAVAFNLIYIYI